MTEMKIDWGSNCFNCGHHEAIVKSTASKIGLFHNGDDVECCNCGNKGVIDCNGEDTDINWDEGLSEELPFEIAQSLKEVS